MAFTYFLRDLHTLEVVVKHVVLYTVGRSHIRIWDAGCAMGQEAYSIAMLLAENMGYFAFKNLRIYASDVDDCSTFGEIIRCGVYQEEEIKRMPGELKSKYFQTAETPNCYRINETLRDLIVYQKHDLLSLKPIGEGFSLVMCKNVLLHFQPAERIEVIRMFHKSLAPNGYFATEQTQKMPAEVAHLFERVTPSAQVFRKIDEKKCG